MQSLWKKAVFCALILTSCLPVSAMNTTGKQPQEDPQNPVSFAAAVKKDGKWGVINDRAEVVIPMQYDKAAITLAPTICRPRNYPPLLLPAGILLKCSRGKNAGSIPGKVRSSSRCPILRAQPGWKILWSFRQPATGMPCMT